MGNPLKKLAAETMIYGLSTILARIVNFLLVPLYTRCLTTGSYGIATEFLAYIAVLQVILTLGLETGCFRFANREGVSPAKVYANAIAAVGSINLAFFAVVFVFAPQIASALGYGDYSNVVVYVGAILLLDNVTAILFARLRQEHKALKFAIIKTTKILLETFTNLYLFLCTGPQWLYRFKTECLQSFLGAEPNFSYIIFSILVSSVICFILLLPDLIRSVGKPDKSLAGQMFAYSLPLMVAMLPGILNDFVDRILFRFLDSSADVWQSSLGIFQAGVKISVIMNLFIQMFRYAAEPFFFQNTGGRQSKELNAKVMEYFTAFCALVFLGVVFYIDIISLLLGKDFRVGVSVVPLMLGSYMLLGMNFNLSMWYKLSDRTSMAVWITLAGLAVTIAVNVIFMPRFSYWAAAAGHFLSYLTMFLINAFLGQKYNPFPYRWGRLALIVGLMLALLFGVSWLDGGLFPNAGCTPDADGGAEVLKCLVHTVILGLFCLVSRRIIRTGKYKTVNGNTVNG